MFCLTISKILLVFEICQAVVVLCDLFVLDFDDLLIKLVLKVLAK